MGTNLYFEIPQSLSLGRFRQIRSADASEACWIGGVEYRPHASDPVSRPGLAGKRKVDQLIGRLTVYNQLYVFGRSNFLQRQFWIPDIRNIARCFQLLLRLRFRKSNPFLEQLEIKALEK